MKNYIRLALEESQNTLKEFIQHEENLVLIEQATELMVNCLKGGGKILSCGNGGSMCDSLHFVEELTGRYRKDRPPMAAMSMGEAGHLTCVANDYGFNQVFSRCVQAWGKKEDVLLAISTSGNSENVLLATQMAKKLGMKTVGLLGKNGGGMKNLVDVPIIVNHNITDRIQEIHIKIIHIFIEGIERQIYPQHYQD